MNKIFINNQKEWDVLPSEFNEETEIHLKCKELSNTIRCPQNAKIIFYCDIEMILQKPIKQINVPIKLHA